MRTKQPWPDNLTPTGQYTIPFERMPQPGIKPDTRRADVCPRCHSLHMTQADAIMCQQANDPRNK